MAVELVSANVVVAAQQFNPSILSQLWLVRNGVVAEDEFGEGCIFAPAITQVITDDFRLLAVPEQLQFAPSCMPEDAGSLVASKVGSIVRTLPHTPYRAAGLNFHWHVTPGASGFSEFARGLFFREHNALYAEFDQEDSRFGAYLSKDVFSCRLRLDVKPITIHSKEGIHECLLLAFNFHRELGSEDRVSEILEHLDRWKEASALAARITRLIDTGDQV